MADTPGMWGIGRSNGTTETVETERWCAGLVSVGTAPMEPAERADLIGWSRMLLTTALFAGAGAIALFVWPVFTPELWRSGRHETAALASLVLSWGLGAPIAAFFALHGLRRRARHEQELRDGVVECFEGAFDTRSGDAEMQRLVIGRAFESQPDGRLRLRVMPRSGTVRLARSNAGSNTWPMWRAVRIRTVAAPPPYELRVTIPRESIGVQDPRVEILRRRMTEDERREVMMGASRLRGAWRVLLLQALIGLILYATILRVVADHAAVAIFAVVALTAWTVHRARRPFDAIRLAARLKRDAEAGLVLTQRRRTEKRVRDAEAADAATDWVDVEFLPVSSLSWTVRGRPAHWRDLAPASRLPWATR